MTFNQSDKYNDIINLEHHQSKHHAHMSIHDRAAQFSPFAALTGYDSQVQETARLTEAYKELDNYDLDKLNMQINQLLSLDNYKKVSVTINYFSPDNKKEGGEYLLLTGFIKKIDAINKEIIMDNDQHINFKFITDIQISNNS
ncbi:hypothetical protein [Lachnospira pectinoschiza]|uniref:YolD-like protein n=1 Tax=Lachnospira pectinoschiza TaxID=28052 RepID=A0A1G9SN03_9FIRM|nr:hypothetical protein [Lachnospira pectinoschiza]SDM36195.1 hypothetical protein SAMN05216544_0010 [Lachnospira pectinoschiza]